MACHQWGSDFDWDGLDNAIDYIAKNLKKWGRVSVWQSKEKFGNCRIYLSFGWDQLHSITHPGYYHSRYPKWLWNLDCLYLSKIVRLLNFIVVPYQNWLYRKLYSNAVKKKPYLHDEILDYADFPELLKNL